MKIRLSSISVAIVISLSNPAVAFESAEECVTTCNQIIDSAEEFIQMQQQAILDREGVIVDMTAQIQQMQALNTQLEDRSNSWYKNPLVMGLLGIAVGATGVIILENR